MHIPTILGNVDTWWFEHINNYIHSSVLNVTMPLLSRAGENGMIWFFIGVILFLTGSKEAKRAAVLMLMALFVSFISGEEVLKQIVQRPRPFETLPGVELLVAPPTSFSFPSGHAASAFACCFVLARKFSSFALPSILLACAMAFSRVYVGVHYPLDVLGGAVLGLASALLVLKYEEAIFHTTQKLKPPFVS